MTVFAIEVKPTSEWTVEEGRKFHEMSLKDRLDYGEKQLEQELPKYIREFNRLRRKHKDERFIDKETFYNHPYWMDEADKICYYGGKNYAQFQLNSWGAISDDEVDAWK